MMSDELRQEGLNRPSMGVSAGLWVGLLLPPVVWAIQMQLNYWAIRGACARGSNVRVYSVTLIALLMILLSGFFAWITARREGTRRVKWGSVVVSTKFMLALSLLSCGVFLVAVVAQGIPAIVFDPCQL